MNEQTYHPTAEHLQALVENMIDGAERAVLESHLLGCAACRGEVEEWQSLFAKLAALPQFAPARNFADRVMTGITLPDPWYVRAAARAGAQLQVVLPRTTRGWAVATACLGMPVAIFSALALWVLSKPYITPTSLLAFGVSRAEMLVASIAQGTLAHVLQSDVALFLARGLATVSDAGAGAAGALAASVAMAIVLSVYVLYQNLFRKPSTPAKREDHNYVSFSF